MTTQQPTSEQVMQWYNNAAKLKTGEFTETLDLASFASLARADPEATVAEQAAEIAALRHPDFREMREMLRAMQAGELTVSRGVEILGMWFAGNWNDDMLPPVRQDLIEEDSMPVEIIDRLQQQLAAAQLHIEKLQKAAILGRVYCPNGSIALDVIDTALSTQPDPSALEAERQRVADACGKVCRNPDGRDVYGFATAVEAGQWKDRMK